MAASAFHPIGSVPRADLARLFDEEAVMWARDLRWNFAPTRARLETALDEGTLSGLVVADDLGACAYATYSLEGSHGIVGSVFASERSRALGIEDLLVHRILNRLRAMEPSVIDSQTLFSSAPGLKAPFAAQGFESAARLYMMIDRPAWLASRRAYSGGAVSKPTHRTDLRSLSRLIYEAHLPTHRLDASSSFDTLESCDRILRQIVLDGVCGPFDSMGSRRIEAEGHLVAACLLTWPLPEVAHISEVATAPSHRLRGLARQCLTEALASAFERGEASSATLSVTASNRAALNLYESLGFAPRINYESHVLRKTGWR
jgi:ribosomal protein S18 acetylase RimI-like enzyme